MSNVPPPGSPPALQARGQDPATAAVLARHGAAAPPADTQLLEAVRPAEKVDKKAVEDATRKITDFVRQSNASVEFSISEDTRQYVVKVIDRDTKEVLKQVPSEEVLQIARALDRLQGLLIRQEA